MCYVALPCLFVCLCLLLSFFLLSSLIKTCIYVYIVCVCTMYMYSVKVVVSSYKESHNDKPMYGYMLPNLSPSPNLYKIQSVYNNNVAS